MDKQIRQLERQIQANPDDEKSQKQLLHLRVKACDHALNKAYDFNFSDDCHWYEKPPGESYYYYCECGAFITRYYWYDRKYAKIYFENAGKKLPIMDVEYWD